MKITLPQMPGISERVTRRVEIFGEDLFSGMQTIQELKGKISPRMKDYAFNVMCINQLFKLARDFSQNHDEGMGCYETAKDMAGEFRKKMVDSGHNQYELICDSQLELIEIEKNKYQRDYGRKILK
jgi:hypothetical protein